MLITFEGIDGCGKSTQMDLLSSALNQKGVDVLCTKQPGGTHIGLQIRKLLLDLNNQAMTSNTELLLYMADRIQHVEEVIRPAIDRGQLVLCDRYHDSTLAYQGGGRKLDLTWLKPLEEKLIQPKITFLLHLSPEACQKRLDLRNQASGEQPCRLESEQKDFFVAVSDAYLQLAQTNLHRFCTLDAAQTVDTIHTQVLHRVLQMTDLK